MSLNVISPAPRDTWRGLYHADPTAFATQSPDWLDCICQTSGFEDASLLYELADGRRLVLPLVRRRWLRGALAVRESLPRGWGIGGPTGSGVDDPSAIRAILADLARRGGLSVRLRPNPIWAQTWRSACHASSIAIPRTIQAVELRDGFLSVERRFHRSVREALRKAERSNLQIDRDTSGRLVPEFRLLFEKSVERWALQKHEPVVLGRLLSWWRNTEAKLHAIAQTMGHACEIWMARSQGRPVGAIMVLKGPNAMGVRMAMDKELAAPTGAMYLLNYLAIGDACESGCGYFSMGESVIGSSAAKWKSRFGTTTFVHDEFRLERFPLTELDRHMRQGIKWATGRS